MFKRLFERLKKAAAKWSEDDAPMMGAALSYYGMFSIAPLLVISIAIAGMVFGFDAAQGQVSAQLKEYVGEDGARTIEAMIAKASEPKRGTWATIFGVIGLLFGALGVFLQLRQSLSRIWRKEVPASSGIWGFVSKYLIGIVMVLGLGLLVMLTVASSAILSAVGQWFQNLLPGGTFLWQAVEIAVSLGILVVAFAIVFKFSSGFPWRDVWLGAVLNAILFVIGKTAFALYLQYAGVQSTFGAAGSLVVVLVWMYYSAQIFFMGAEFVCVTHGMSTKQTPEEAARAKRPPEKVKIRERRDLAPAVRTALPVAALAGVLVGRLLGRRPRPA
jgi:membrane protein